MIGKNTPTITPTVWKNHWHNYREPRPVNIRGKVHWAVTKPSPLWKKNDRDKKLSSGTSDRKVAEERKWYIAAKIYQYFDDEINKSNSPEAKFHQFWKIAQDLWVAYDHSLDDFFSSFPSIDHFGLPHADDVIRLFHSMNIRVPDTLVELVDSEATFLLTNLPSFHDYANVRMNYFYETNNQFPESGIGLDRQLKDRIVMSSNPDANLKVLSKRYLDESRWGRERTKSGARLALSRFISVVEAKDVHEITTKDAYVFARYLEREHGSANKTIKSSISYVKGLFTWCITNPDMRDFVGNPFSNLDLSKYGRESESYQPFDINQLHDLFGLTQVAGKGRMNMREHLLFAILIATGCRLDEAALLSWDNIIAHKDGWFYIDLRNGIVKNSGSKRLLPVPYKLQQIMPPTGQQLTPNGLCHSSDGRLFNYSIDGDGKASRAASQALARQIQKIKARRRQVAHSLRGNLKDMLRDVGVSKELNDYITGHAQGDVASSYGSGHSIELRYKALNGPDHLYLKAYVS